ncbi:bacterial regulatory s, luxR family protein [Collimonas arenae]|uniref:Bacterial regulatory s, luxR family protein n=1 Tax=Collimonas arenae TaxID=279058 RepID=A0A127QIG0_9BURK|nr:response regulator transcription factor [Collimonas arenae]AMP09595.1 bacterial regulatory s, luxR family protein [Collimonas arenae]
MLHSSTKSIRIAILDDHAIVRHGMTLRFAKESDFDVVGVYATGREMIEGLRNAPAEILLVDYSLGPTEIDGINLLQVLKIKAPESKILVVSAHNNPATVELVMRAGAKGFVAKADQLSTLVDAIRLVAAGGIYEEGAATALPDQVDASTSAGKAVTDYVVAADAGLKGQSLSPREREVIRCCLDGMSVIEIAKKFSKSRKTISTQKQAAMSKLGLQSDSELFALRDRGEIF